MGLAAPLKTLWEVYGEPTAEYLGLYETADRSYGRWKTPFSSMEQRLYENADVEVTFHKVMLENGKDWVWYQIWQDVAAVRATGRNADMIFVHGTGVHSGTLASQCRRYLSAGFRLLVPDLPSHGYSSGLHVCQSDIRSYCSGLHAVLHDVALRDQRQSAFPSLRLNKQDRKKTFMLGLSFGGLVAFSYAMHYPGSYRYEESDNDEIPIDGIVGVGPMVERNSKGVVFSPVLVWALLFMLFVLRLGRLEIFVPHKKVVDKDPKVYESLIMQDPRSHQGAFRLGHMYCIHSGMAELQRRAAEIKHPIYVQAGGQDQVADNEVALNWMRNLSSEDRRFEVYPVCQHVIYKKGESEHDDLAGRITVIADNVEWMCQRSPVIRGRAQRMSSYLSEASSVGQISHASSIFDDEELSDTASSTCTVPSPAVTFPDESITSGESTPTDFNAASKTFCPGHGSATLMHDVRGDKRLYRNAWAYGENTRPFLLYPYQS